MFRHFKDRYQQMAPYLKTNCIDIQLYNVNYVASWDIDQLNERVHHRTAYIFIDLYSLVIHTLSFPFPRFFVHFFDEHEQGRKLPVINGFETQSKRC